MDPKQLLQLAQDTTIAGRSRLAQAISHFFEDHDLSEVEHNIAGDILMNLVRQAEIDLREAIAERLSAMDNVPAEVMQFLANDEISVARDVLMHSPMLNDADLSNVIRTKGQEHWRQIAKRPTLSPLIADKLIDTSDPSTVMNLLENQRTRLQKGSVKKIIRVALASEELHAPLLRRPEIDADLAIDMYMVVSHALRNEIVERFKVQGSIIEKSLEILVQELTNEARGRKEVTPHMLNLARRFQERGEINTEMMIRTLRRGQMSFFVALLSERVGFSPEVMMKVIQKDSGKGFVVVCRYLNMIKSEFASIFLLSRGIRNGDKIVDQRELAMALKHYDTLKDSDVILIMKSWARNRDLI